MDEAVELRRDLRELVEAVRAYVEWHGVVGGSGFPRADAGSAATAASVVTADAVVQRAMVAGGDVAPAASPGPVAAAPDLDAASSLRLPAPTASGSLSEASLSSAPTPPFGAGAERGEEASQRVVQSSPAARHEAPAAGGVAPPPASAAVRDRLVQLEREVASCEACRLHLARRSTVFARGSAASPLCFVGEGPGAEEDLRGTPFVGPAGQLLDRMVEAMGFGRDEVYICNIVKCRPPDNRRPQPDEMDACRRFLDEQLSLVAPEVIVALGATAVQGLFGTNEGITKLRGKWRLYRGRVAVMPTFHPAYLLRTPSAKRLVWSDLKEVLRHLGREPPRR